MKKNVLTKELKTFMLILKKLQGKQSLHTLSQPKSSNWNVYESSHSMKRV
jgi:hypothetical protein